MTFFLGVGLGALLTISAAFIAANDKSSKKKNDVDEEDDIWYT